MRIVRLKSTPAVHVSFRRGVDYLAPRRFLLDRGRFDVFHDLPPPPPRPRADACHSSA
jgi:hypothetical protein